MCELSLFDIMILRAHLTLFLLFCFQMKIGVVTPGQLRAVCEKGLLLVTITIPEMEVNFIFSLLIDFMVVILPY